MKPDWAASTPEIQNVKRYNPIFFFIKANVIKLTVSILKCIYTQQDFPEDVSSERGTDVRGDPNTRVFAVVLSHSRIY